MERYEEDDPGGCVGEQNLHGAGVAKAQGGGLLSEGRNCSEG